jgi:hypothetical protein
MTRGKGLAFNIDSSKLFNSQVYRKMTWSSLIQANFMDCISEPLPREKTRGIGSTMLDLYPTLKEHHSSQSQSVLRERDRCVL